MLTTLDNRFHIRSNRESGFGRYDIVLEPKDSQKDDAFVLEFKIHNPEREKTLEETVTAALEQIREKRYFSELQERGINAARIHAYGFAFCGKKVLVG